MGVGAARPPALQPVGHHNPVEVGPRLELGDQGQQLCVLLLGPGSAQPPAQRGVPWGQLGSSGGLKTRAAAAVPLLQQGRRQRLPHGPVQRPKGPDQVLTAVCCSVQEPRRELQQGAEARGQQVSIGDGGDR